MRLQQKPISIVSFVVISGATFFLFQNCNPNQAFHASSSQVKSEQITTERDVQQSVGDPEGVMLCNKIPCDNSNLISMPTNGIQNLPTSGHTVSEGGSGLPSNTPSNPSGGTDRTTDQGSSNNSNTGSRQISSTQSLTFNNLTNLPIFDYAFYLPATTLRVASNSVVLSALPSDGATLKIIDSANKNVEGNTCQFAFNINNESSSYCEIKKDRKVYNGDVIKFIGVPSRFFNQEHSVFYEIGSVYSGTWSIKTMDNPGVKPIFSGSFGTLTRGKAGSPIYSGVVTVSGLSSQIVGLGVPIIMEGLDKGFELIKNGERVAAKNTVPTYGIRIKNGDQLQLKIEPSSAGTIYRAKLILEKIGTKETSTYTQSDYIDWSVQTDSSSSQITNYFCEGGKLSLSSIDETKKCEFSWQAASLKEKAKVSVSEGARLEATCTENEKLWTYNFHCPGQKIQSCYGGQVANVPSKTKANTYCAFSWGMTEVGQMAVITATNKGTANGFVCLANGTYKEGTFICP